MWKYIIVFGDVIPTQQNLDGLGCDIVLSGGGCKQFFDDFCSHQRRYHAEEDWLPYGLFFSRCERYTNRRIGKLDYHVTRLDIAIDDRNETPYFTVEQLHKKCLKEEFISKSRSFRFIESDCWERDTAKTLYIGDGKSNLSFRFYDKDKEQCVKYNVDDEKMGSWKRTEMQLRDEMAHGFAQRCSEQTDELEQLAFD